MVHIETVGIDTIDGLHLEGDLALAILGPHAHGPDALRGAVVIAHPHPQYGGTRTNQVVDALFRTLPRVGFHALRFDFRGVGNSEGVFGGGDDERLDVAAAVDLLAPLVEDLPLWVAGYSFGAMVALGVIDPRVHGWVAVAPPLRGPAPLAASDHRPKLVLAPEHDQFSPSAATRERVGSWRTTTLETVEMADHFLAGRTTAVADRVAAWLVGV